ncbi:MAG: M23 family metallopeptidase [Candidatus Obscuribacterales bacterium]|nr:M23 family metallopeptidase [Candidatus Obscuribacterales bacterium]
MQNKFSSNRAQFLTLFAVFAVLLSSAVLCALAPNKETGIKELPMLQAAEPLSRDTTGTRALAELVDEHCDYDELADEIEGGRDSQPSVLSTEEKKSASRDTAREKRAPITKAVAKRIPVKNTRITSKYGMRVHPVTRKHRFHNGVDFSAKLNQRVYSVLDGKVVRCGPRGALGIAVEIYHPAKRTTTIYGHLNKKLVACGQTVKAGQPIGLSGTTGRSTGVHLHFIVKQHAKTVEPLRFLASLPGYLPGQQSTSSNIASADVSSSHITETSITGLEARAARKKSRSTAAGQTKLDQRKRNAEKYSVRKREPHRTQLASASTKRKHSAGSNSQKILSGTALVANATVKNEKSTKPSALSRIADGARLAAEMTSELAHAKQALSVAQRRSATDSMLYNEGAISAHEATKSKQAADLLQQRVNQLERRI